MQWRDTMTEQAIVAAGSHPVSDWWAGVLDDVLAQDPRRVIVRGGRRGGKTTSAIRCLVYQLFERQWAVDRADIGVVPIVSARRWQTVDRIRTCREYINALAPDAETGKPAMDRIDLTLPWGRASIRSFVASKAGVVSATMVAALLDEVALWVDDRGANPASQVISSLTPSLLSTGGSLWMVSTPWGTDDAHAKAFDRGNGDGQLVYYCPTWVGRPDLTEDMTHELEPDDIEWRRNYLAEPQHIGDEWWLNGLLIDRAIDRGRDMVLTGEATFADRREAAGDLGFMRDASAVSVASTIDGLYAPCALWERRPISEPLEPIGTTRDGLRFALDHGASRIMTDSYARALLIELARELSIGYVSRPEGNPHWAFARRMLASDRLVLPACNGLCVCDGSGICDRLVKQLRRIRGRVQVSGISIEHERLPGSHGDLAEAWAQSIWQLRQNTDAATIGARATFG